MMVLSLPNRNLPLKLFYQNGDKAAKALSPRAEFFVYETSSTICSAEIRQKFQGNIQLCSSSRPRMKTWMPKVKERMPQVMYGSNDCRRAG
ncbi:hypothetical protein NPIL_303031 [Nephila pilipes]|uniref:Uncharacterized protein n=1 Tax=Nephila pilipes TaxID=299642 RepID=A0A8X6T4E4_NEPPI|nr:hypothetical protein NPIL_303031 [Nephila pilipes]